MSKFIEPSGRPPAPSPTQPAPEPAMQHLPDKQVQEPSKPAMKTIDTVPEKMDLQVLESNLSSCLQIIGEEVMKGYVAHMSDMEPIPLDVEGFEQGFEQVQFFRITELVYEKDEFSVDKLSTVFHTLSGRPCTVVLMIRSDGRTNEFYLGVRSMDANASTGTMRQVLSNSLTGMFPGSRIEQFPEETLNDTVIKDITEHANAVSGVTCIADYKQMSKDTGSDYKGALQTRLKSLTNGINGMIFSNSYIADGELFEMPTIIDLSRVGSTEAKSLLMGILLLKLQEYRMSGGTPANSSLRHITVLEEAHHLLKKTSTEQGQEIANLQGKSVEMLTNAIAEMRTYGEGFIIADQAPDLLDTAVIRNTNTKIVMRLPEGNDREITGVSMALNEEQVKELSKLPQGVGAVFQSNWQEAVLCKVEKYKYTERSGGKDTLVYSPEPARDEKPLLHRPLTAERMDAELEAQILRSDAPALTRRQLIQSLEKKNMVFEWAMADYITNRFAWKMIFDGTHRTCSTIEELGEKMLTNISDEFNGFSLEESRQICYYICRKAYEENPQNALINEVRVSYFQGR